MAQYNINLLSPSGIFIKDIAAFHMLQWARAENTIGVAELWLPAKLIDPSFLAVDQILEIERNGGILNETAYFLREAYYTMLNGIEVLYLKGYDANYLLGGKIIAYAAGSAEGNKSDYADDMMKEIVDENLVNPTDTARTTPNLTISSDLGLGPSIDMAIARDNVLEACRDIADLSTDRGTYMAFDVVRVSRGSWQFRTYTGQRGQDHSQSGDAGLRLIGPQYGNLQNATVTLFDRSDERNVAYAGGQGEEAAREVSELEDTTRSSASQYNRREVWVDARNTTTQAEREDKGYQALEKYRPIQTLTGDLVDTRGFRYGIDYGFGDLVTATAYGYTTDCHIDKISAIVRSGGEAGDIQSEVLTTALRGEL